MDGARPAGRLSFRPYFGAKGAQERQHPSRSPLQAGATAWSSQGTAEGDEADPRPGGYLLTGQADSLDPLQRTAP